MAKHFTSLLRLVSNSKDATELSGGECLSIGRSSKPAAAVTLPGEPHPPGDMHQALQGASEYNFDGIISEEETSSSGGCMESVREIVDNMLAGYNATILSLSTSDTASVSKHAIRHSKHGAILKASRQIFRCLTKSRKTQAKACSNLVVLCSAVIVVKEEVHDLLAKFSDQEEASSSTDLSLVDGSIKGSSEVAVEGVRKMSALLEYAADVEETVLRSYHKDVPYHVMCRISVEYAQFGSMNAPISGSLVFVDVGSTHFLSCDQASSKEALSVHTFAQVVKSLSKDQTNEDNSEALLLANRSALTQLLKEGLGGNSKTLLLTFAPEQFLVSKYPEVHAALELASLARLIQNNPNRKDIAEKALMSAYMRELHERYGGTEGVAAPTSDHGAQESTKSDQRQTNMEMAAMALVTALERGGDSDSDDELDPLLQSVQAPSRGKIKIRRRSTKPMLASADSAGGDDVDVLISILQDPDTGAPRPSPAALDNVKLRTDVGAIFSGATIVQWLTDNVAGVGTEERAVRLGQLLLTRGALVHSEGSM